MTRRTWRSNSTSDTEQRPSPRIRTAQAPWKRNVRASVSIIIRAIYQNCETRSSLYGHVPVHRATNARVSHQCDRTEDHDIASSPLHIRESHSNMITANTFRTLCSGSAADTFFNRPIITQLFGQQIHTVFWTRVQTCTHSPSSETRQPVNQKPLKPPSIRVLLSNTLPMNQPVTPQNTN